MAICDATSCRQTGIFDCAGEYTKVECHHSILHSGRLFIGRCLMLIYHHNYHIDVLNRFDVSNEEIAIKYQDKFNENMNRNFIKDHIDS